MKPDETIDAIRSVRRQIAQECDEDPHKLIQHYIEQQKANPRRLRKTAKRSTSHCP